MTLTVPRGRRGDARHPDDPARQRRRPGPAAPGRPAHQGRPLRTGRDRLAELHAQLAADPRRDARGHGQAQPRRHRLRRHPRPEAGRHPPGQGPCGQVPLSTPSRTRSRSSWPWPAAGVTPAMAILRIPADRQLDLPVTPPLRVPDSRRRDLRPRAGRPPAPPRPRSASCSTLSRPRFRLGRRVRPASTPDLLARHVADPASARFFICGPAPMRDALVGWLAARGVPSDRVHTEQFGKARPAAVASAL